MQAPTPTQISPEQVKQLGDAVAQQGRVLATLDDWRAILFVAVLLLIVSAIVACTIIVVLLRANRQERRDIAAERDRMWGIAGTFGEAATKLTGELQVQQILNARVESALGKCEQFQRDALRDGKPD